MIMAWTIPTLVEICIGMEINGYLPAEFWAVPASRRTPPPDGRDPLRRRAADAGAWTRPDVAAEADHVRRALARACAKRRRAHVPDHHGDPRGRIDGADRRAERLRGFGHVRPRLFDRDGIPGARGQRPGAY